MKWDFNMVVSIVKWS